MKDKKKLDSKEKMFAATGDREELEAEEDGEAGAAALKRIQELLPLNTCQEIWRATARVLYSRLPDSMRAEARRRRTTNDDDGATAKEESARTNLLGSRPLPDALDATSDTLDSVASDALNVVPTRVDNSPPLTYEQGYWFGEFCVFLAAGKTLTDFIKQQDFISQDAFADALQKFLISKIRNFIAEKTRVQSYRLVQRAIRKLSKNANSGIYLGIGEDDHYKKSRFFAATKSAPMDWIFDPLADEPFSRWHLPDPPPADGEIRERASIAILACHFWNLASENKVFYMGNQRNGPSGYVSIRSFTRWLQLYYPTLNAEEIQPKAAENSTGGMGKDPFEEINTADAFLVDGHRFPKAHGISDAFLVRLAEGLADKFVPKYLGVIAALDVNAKENIDFAKIENALGITRATVDTYLKEIQRITNEHISLTEYDELYGLTPETMPIAMRFFSFLQEICKKRMVRPQ